MITKCLCYMVGNHTDTNCGCLCHKKEEPKMKIDKFWIVAKNGSHNTLTAQKRHNTLNDATTEAARLARVEDALFYVLECIGAAQPTSPPIEWIVAEESEIF